MGFRFRRRIKLLPGIRLYISKSGLSTSLGEPGATINLRGDNVRTTVKCGSRRFAPDLNTTLRDNEVHIDRYWFLW